MTESASPVCFHCGQAIDEGGDEPRLNRLEDGRPCPACADRLLEMLPSLVRGVAAEMQAVERDESLEALDEGYLPDEPA